MALIISPWTALGVLGSLAVTLTGPRLAAGPRWWFSPGLTSNRPAAMAVCYAGMLALCVAFVGLGLGLRRARDRAASAPGAGLGPLGQVRLVAALWALPLLVAPPLFSSDSYSYLAQGTILARGLNPYRATPLVLAHIGAPGVLGAVSPFWRATTAPYGPLFLVVVRAVVAVTGTHLVAGVLGCRLVEVAGLVLVARYLARLARHLGADPAVASWLCLASPLVLLELVAAGHNDALMAGLLVAGVALTLEGRPLIGLVALALATMVKLPAAAGFVLVVVALVRDAPDAATRWRRLAEALGIAVAVVAAVSLASGLGLSWMTSEVLSAPGKVHLAITPVTAVAYSAARALHSLGISVAQKHLEHILAGVALAATGLVAALAAWRVRLENLVSLLGVVLVAAVLGGPAAWPWYLTWALVVLSALSRIATSWSSAVVVTASVFLVKPDGILALPLDSAPGVVGVSVVALGLAWFVHRDRRPLTRFWRDARGAETPDATDRAIAP